MGFGTEDSLAVVGQEPAEGGDAGFGDALHERAVGDPQEPGEVFRARLDPSAMFAETDTADRRICDVSPNRSSEGNPPDRSYTRSAKSIDFRHTCNFSNPNSTMTLSR